MPRRILSLLFFLLLVSQGVSGQIRGILGFPDRVMSSSRIGRTSSRNIPEIPSADTSRIIFPPYGTKPLAGDYGFFNYLVDNGLSLDAKTLIRMPYAKSDTLDFLRAKVLFLERKLSQASEYFSKVPASSPFGPESFYYRIVSLSSSGQYDRAAELLSPQGAPPAFSKDGPYAELTALQSAGLALLRGDKDEWMRSSSAFTFEDYTLSESERVLSEIALSRFESAPKHAGVAALASAIVPGAGKLYAGRVGEGVAAFLTVGSLGAITAENWNRHGPKDWRTIVAGSLCAVFYLGNIYGSYLSVSIENNEHVAAENTAIVYHLHIPLRSIFR